MRKKQRILVEGLSDNFGGTEAVISNYVNALSSDFTFDFVVERPLNNHLDLLSDGGKQIIISNRHSDPIGYYRALYRFMRENSCLYDIAWINKNNFGNMTVLSLCRKAGIPKRILHFHSLEPVSRKRYQLLVDAVNEPKAKLDATDFWVCSSAVGEKYFQSLNYRVMPNAFDFESFKFSNECRNAIRGANGIGDSELLIGTIGRIEERKNQLFLLDVVKKLSDDNLKVKLIIVGDGPLKGSLREKARKLGIGKNIITPGAVSNPASYLSAFDVFVFPSLNEGLGIAAIEAQVNGLPCVVSDALSNEIEISNEVIYLPTNKPDVWADTIMGKTRSSVVLSGTSRQFDIAIQKEFIRSSFIL